MVTIFPNMVECLDVRFTFVGEYQFQRTVHSTKKKHVHSIGNQFCKLGGYRSFDQPHNKPAESIRLRRR